MLFEARITDTLSSRRFLLSLLHTSRPIFSAAFFRITFRLYLYVSITARERLPVLDGG
jgi:hypothetical protein